MASSQLHTVNITQSQSSTSQFAVSVDGRVVYFYNQSTNQVIAISTQDGSEQHRYLLDTDRYCCTSSRSATWFTWLSNYLYSSDSTNNSIDSSVPWQLLRIVSHRLHGLLLCFFNRQQRLIHLLLYHLNKKRDRVVLLDSHETRLPADWTQMVAHVQTVDQDYAIYIDYCCCSASTNEIIRQYHAISCSVGDGHIVASRSATIDQLPSGIWSWLGESEQYHYHFLLWNRQSVIRSNTKYGGWESIELQPDADMRIYPPPAERCIWTVPLIKSRKAWFCVFVDNDDVGVIWMLDLIAYRWKRYPQFDRLGSSNVVIRKMRNAIQVTIMGKSDGRHKLGQITFAQDSCTAVLTCPVCCQLFKEPVTLSCGHSMCSVCLALYARENNVLKCVICHRRISISGNMPVSIVLKEVINELQKESPNEFCGDCARPHNATDMGQCLTCHPYGAYNVVYCGMCLLQNHKNHQFDLKTNDNNDDFHTINFVP